MAKRHARRIVATTAAAAVTATLLVTGTTGQGCHISLAEEALDGGQSVVRELAATSPAGGIGDATAQNTQDERDVAAAHAEEVAAEQAVVDAKRALEVATRDQGEAAAAVAAATKDKENATDALAGARATQQMLQDTFDAAQQENRGSIGFFDSEFSVDTLDGTGTVTNQKSQAAIDILTNTSVTEQNTGTVLSSYTVLDEDGHYVYNDDAIELTNMREALDWIEWCNENIRKPNNLPEYKVTHSLMASAQRNANFSSHYGEHGYPHAVPSVWTYDAENMAVGSTNAAMAYRGWFANEKSLWERALLNDPQLANHMHDLSSYNPELYHSVGHYINLINASYVLTGLGINSGGQRIDNIIMPYTSVQHFASSAGSEAVYTVAEYRALLQAYYKTYLTDVSDNVNTLQETLGLERWSWDGGRAAAQAAVNQAQANLTDADATLAQANDALAAANTAIDSARQALRDARSNAVAAHYRHERAKALVGDTGPASVSLATSAAMPASPSDNAGEEFRTPAVGTQSNDLPAPSAETPTGDTLASDATAQSDGAVQTTPRADVTPASEATPSEAASRADVAPASEVFASEVAPTARIDGDGPTPATARTSDVATPTSPAAIQVDAPAVSDGNATTVTFRAATTFSSADKGTASISSRPLPATADPTGVTGVAAVLLAGLASLGIGAAHRRK